MTEIKDKVDRNVKKQVSVEVTFPSNVYGKLKDFSKENASNCFWLAIDKLIDYYNFHESEDERPSSIKMLDDKIDFAMSRVMGLEQDLEILKKLNTSSDNEKKIKTFGKGDEE